MIGGSIGKETLNSTWEYNIVENKIVPKDGMHQQRFAFGIAFDQLQSTIYVLGGDGGYSLNSCEKYCVSKNEWIVISSMAEEKANVSACIVNNQFIYAIGGYDGGYKDTIEKYDIQKNEWETL